MDIRLKRQENPPLSPPVFYILLALADRERHGYAIMQEVERRTRDKVRLLPGSLYSTIKRMLQAGLIVECDAAEVDPDNEDERRRYYRITPAGREAARQEVDRMSTLIEIAGEKKLTESLAEARETRT